MERGRDESQARLTLSSTESCLRGIIAEANGGTPEPLRQRCSRSRRHQTPGLPRSKRYLSFLKHVVLVNLIDFVHLDNKHCVFFIGVF